MREEGRPDPDEILRRLHLQEERADRHRGQLKLFAGYAAGVGKTYQMLAEARAAKAHGMDVVVGLVETHGRPETEALLEGLEILPRKQVPYRDIVLEELDLDAVLARRPRIALVDELAHTNAPGMRHDKRWQDVDELLEAGIDVYTALNVQHAESLNDVVEQITGVRVQETVPDRILRMADEIKLVDLPPEDLLARLSEGKVYVPAKAEQAARKFFRKGNLLALRQLSLRFTASRVDDAMRSYMEVQGISGPWHAGARLLVSVSASPFSERLVRVAARMASDMSAEWYALYVESPAQQKQAAEGRERLAHNLALAEQLGAEVVFLSGDSIADVILSFARTHNVTTILVGWPRLTRLRDRIFGSVISELIKASGPIHVLVVGADSGEPVATPPPSRAHRNPLPRYAGSLSMVVVVTALCWLFRSQLGTLNVNLLLLLPVIVSGVYWGMGPGLFASLLAVLSFDFFFVLPVYTLAVSDLRFLPNFFVFFIVGALTAFLAQRVRFQASSARQRERFVSALYGFGRELIEAPTREEILRQATATTAEAFAADVLFLLPDSDGLLEVAARAGDDSRIDEREKGVATWAFEHGQAAGRGTDTLSSVSWRYLPLIYQGRSLGILGIRPQGENQFLPPDQRQLLESFTNIIAMALSREPAQPDSPALTA